VELELSLLAFGGRIAEELIFGERPDRGWNIDQLTIFMRLAHVRCGDIDGLAELAMEADSAPDGALDGIIGKLGATVAKGLGNIGAAEFLEAYEARARGAESPRGELRRAGSTRGRVLVGGLPVG